MTSPAFHIPQALRQLTTNDLDGAVRTLTEALASRPDDLAALSLLGIVLGRMGDAARSAEVLRQALVIAPEDEAVRVNLVRALTELGRWQEIIALCAVSPASLKLRRMVGYARHATGDLAGARADYEVVVAADPADFESWNNLGNVLAESTAWEAAINALLAANRLRPDVTQIHLNLAKAFAHVQRLDDARETMRHAAAITPNDPEVQTELGLAEAALQHFDAAEAAFRAAIAQTVGFTPAYIELGLLLENQNRLDDLAELIERAAEAGVEREQVALLRAWLLRRRERFDEALIEAQSITVDIRPLRRHQLLAELADRRGDAVGAIREFTAMNTAALADAPPLPPGPTYREEIAAAAAQLTKDRIASWRDGPQNTDAPIFIVGFPRSGTTLLDTLLMNDPRFHVLEEQPILRQLETAFPDVAALDDAVPSELRARYAAALELIAPAAPGRIVVDKFPLHLARIPLIHRTFPDARIVLVERHPCDAVLSAFMANFQLNRAMRHMTTIAGAAELYDTAFVAFTLAEQLLPLRVHRVRYERMIDDLESEMRALLAFLDVSWDERVLDNQASAAKRAHIRTASYSQVAEPLYRRAIERWERYRFAMEPVLPILAPWCERMGYAWRRYEAVS